MAEDIMMITPLGAGQEVGRSCHVLEFRGMTILLDCGIHPGFDGLNGLPFLDRIEPDSIDVVLITHFHLDHAASLPYLTERTNFQGRIFMTHPTKAVLRLLLGDYLRLLSMKNSKPEDVLYTEAELNSCLEKVELVDFHTTVTVGGVLSFHALNAGHVLGACMFFLEIGGRSVLYTGDYSMEDDRHLMAAEIPYKKPDLLIVEATYGVQVHASRAEREARFTHTIDRVVSRGGRCLIPVFALGRAQELLLILDEYWHANPQLQDIPIWYASKLASRALRVYQTYANMMNARIRAQMDISNPFKFRFIQNLKSIDVNTFDDSGPSVVFASPGMLQSGVSRQLFDRWASNPNNGVLIAGYAVEHTLAKEIMAQPKEVVTLEGRRQPLNCLVDYVSFSAHVDFVQNRSFITQVSPRHVVLVHGQKDEMGRLKSALMLQYKSMPEPKRPTITMPPNLQEVKLRFARRRSAKVMGSLATTSSSSSTTTTTKQHKEEQEEEEEEEDNHNDKEDQQKPQTPHQQRGEAGQSVHGILVTHNFQSKIVAPHDLATYTPLRVGTIRSKLHVPFGGSVATLRIFLTEMFAGITVQEEQQPQEETTSNIQLNKNGDESASGESGTGTNADNNNNKIIKEEETNNDGVSSSPSSSPPSSSSSCRTIFQLGDLVQVVVDRGSSSGGGGGGGSSGTAIVEWEASPHGDVLADAVVALILHAQSSAASVRMTSQPCRHVRARDSSSSSMMMSNQTEDAEDGNHEDDDDIGDQKTKKKKIKMEQSAALQQTSTTATVVTMENRLKLIYRILKEQFESVEAIYEGTSATYEIHTDSGFVEQQQQAATAAAATSGTSAASSSGTSSGATNANTLATSSTTTMIKEEKVSSSLDNHPVGSVKCTVQIEFVHRDVEAAHVAVESRDPQLASQVRQCIQSLAHAIQPIQL